MKNTTAITLVVGSDSLVGRALMGHLERAGEHVVGTTRRRDPVDESHLYLDLSEDSVDKWRCPWLVAVAVICACVTKLEACANDPVGTARVNVQGVAKLATKLVAEGAFVIYLSSNQVFDGTMPHRLPNDPVSPVTEYGRQKAEAERQMRQWGGSVAIVRFTKILEPKPPLFSAWAKSLKNDEIIQPFSDMAMAPIPLSCAVSVLRLLADLRLPGIFQLSGDRDISYAEAARMGAKMLKADPSLVQPVEAFKSGRFTECIPTHTTLNTDRLRSTFGIVAPEVGWTIETAFQNSRG